MFPLSPYARPVSSFTLPVNKPLDDPAACPLVQVTFSEAWLPLILAALNQLLLQSTWKGTPSQQLDAIQQASYLQSLFTSGLRIPCKVPPTPGQSMDCEDCDMCCIRWQNGVLQILSCGVWTPVPGMPPGSGSNQPGNGSPQPPPNGGTATYNGCMVNGGTFLIPTLLSTGDIVELTNFVGATNDPDDGSLVWRCYDGNLFIAGVCVPNDNHTLPGDPLNTRPHMSVIGFIAGNYYDLSSGPFTIPAGIVQQQMIVQLNDNILSNDNGSLCFNVNVTNNGIGTFSHDFDFTISGGGWVAIDTGAGPEAVYAGGSGWTSVGGVLGPVSSTCNIVIDLPARTISSLQITFTVAESANTANREFDVVVGGVESTYGTFFTAAGSYNLLLTNSVSGVTSIRVYLGRDILPEEGAVISRIVVDGLGTDPF